MTDSKTVVIVAPHPDDAELALGGTIIKLIEAEWEVVLIDLTDGEPTPWGSKEQRARETAKASALLGVRERACLGMPNRYLEASLENRRMLARVLRERKPATVFGPGASDAHPDHTEAARLVEVSCFEARLHQTDVPGEPHRVDRIYNYQPMHRLSCEKPLFVVDVTRVWDRKVAAIEAYESQLKNGPRGGGSSWIDRVAAVCRYYGESGRLPVCGAVLRHSVPRPARSVPDRRPPHRGDARRLWPMSGRRLSSFGSLPLPSRQRPRPDGPRGRKSKGARIVVIQAP